MTDQELYDALAGAFAHSAKTGKPAALTLERGTHGRALQRPTGAKELILFRPNGNPPSAATCERISVAAGLLKPKYQVVEVLGHDGYKVTDATDYSALCAHSWGDAVTTTTPTKTTLINTCANCGAAREVTTRRINGKADSVKQKYNGFSVSSMTLLGVTDCGPIPEGVSHEVRERVRAQHTQRKAAAAQAKRLDTPQTVRPPLTGQVCGNCKHGVLTEFDEVECQLGWEAHDPPLYFEQTKRNKDGTDKRDKNGKPVTKWLRSNRTGYPHGDALKPLLAPQTKCMAYEGSSFLPKRR